MRFGRILIALDHSVLSAYAAEVGIDLACRLKAEAALVHAVDPNIAETLEDGSAVLDQIVQAMVQGRSLLERVAKRAKLPSAPFEFVPVGHPASEIVKTAVDWRAEILVIGSHRWSEVKRLGQSSVTDEVMRHAPCPIFVVRANE